MELQHKRILFLGDSITEGSGTSGPGRRFTDRIAAMYGAVCVNGGIGGTCIARQRTPSPDPAWDRDFCSRVEELEPGADAVVVFGGTNDFGHGDAPMGRMEDRTADTFYGALHVLFTSLIDRYPGAAVVAVTPLHRCNEENPRGSGKPQDGPLLRDYVDAILEVARFYSLPVLDLYGASGLQPRVPGIQRRYIPDGLHPNDAGHAILADKIARFLLAL